MVGHSLVPGAEEEHLVHTDELPVVSPNDIHYIEKLRNCFGAEVPY